MSITRHDLLAHFRFASQAMAAGLVCLGTLAGCGESGLSLQSGTCADVDYVPTFGGDNCADRTDNPTTFVAGTTVDLTFELYAVGASAGTFDLTATATATGGDVSATASPERLDVDGTVETFVVSVAIPADACGDLSATINAINADDETAQGILTAGGTIVDGAGAAVACP